jgi:molybdopterin synthase catalytic subunit
MAATDDPATGAALVHPDDDGALVRRAIDPARLLAAVASPAAGASLVFVGSVRGTTGDVVTTAIEYEAHETMAAFAIEQLCTSATDRFRLVACAVEHRLGRLGPGDVSVAVATAAPHRRAAFEAAEWLMERIKREVPIWKREEGPEGKRDWSHPGGPPPPPGGGAA